MRYILIILLFTGCYTEKKARQSVVKADASYPAMIAKYCADKFPVIERMAVGDSLFVIDTVYEGDIIIQADTVTVNDTVRIVRTIPGKTITVTKTITRVDTIWQKSTAEIKACEIVRDQAVQLATDKTAEAGKYKKQARTRLYFLLGLLLAAGVFGYFKIKSSIIKK